MADIQRLAASARLIKSKSDQSVGWKLAAMKAVEASGVRHKPDVKRFSAEIVQLLKKQGVIPKKRRQTRSRSISRF